MADKTDSDSAKASAPHFEPITSITLLDVPLRFLALYLTTLFSLDPWTAAQCSPYSVRSSQSTWSSRSNSRRQWNGGEAASVGMRLDPGGPTNPTRRGGFGGGSGGATLDVTPCPSCTRPQAQIHN